MCWEWVCGADKFVAWKGRCIQKTVVFLLNKTINACQLMAKQSVVSTSFGDMLRYLIQTSHSSGDLQLHSLISLASVSFFTHCQALALALLLLHVYHYKHQPSKLTQTCFLRRVRYDRVILCPHLTDRSFTYFSVRMNGYMYNRLLSVHVLVQYLKTNGTAHASDRRQ